MIDTRPYREACVIFGLPSPRWLIDGYPAWQETLTQEQQDLADLIWTVVRDPDNSTAVAELRDTFGSGSTEWLNFLDLKEKYDYEEKSGKYATEVLGRIIDFLLDSCTVYDYNGHKLLEVDEAALSKIKAIRDILNS